MRYGSYKILTQEKLFKKWCAPQYFTTLNFERTELFKTNNLAQPHYVDDLITADIIIEY